MAVPADDDRPLTKREKRQVATCIAYGQIGELVEWAVGEAMEGRGPLLDKRRGYEATDGDVATWQAALLAVSAEMFRREDRAYDRLGTTGRDRVCVKEGDNRG